ncbi:hypothetical protein [Leptolyngbya sp. FACHB-711]|uniref:hypothetical protein n=1 Tax=unclassified Leptolyngbya TaxID=2650499 RepID=UPI001685BF27|nr:hypothetical protein [Leptolyngbya sp. FACHB-711]MBD1851907.1 hypothetical protein [Cyanobacteria bacterium FACHB-502]MBD2023585.1 hypothetical protein [Leptolyngbya sp. FACHB-711]
MLEKNRLSNRLFDRLNEALQSGSKVWIEVPGDRYAGRPIYLDSEFVEVLCIYTPDKTESSSEPCLSTTWLIRLSQIVAVAYPSEQWSADRLTRLLQAQSPKPERDEPAA